MGGKKRLFSPGETHQSSTKIILASNTVDIRKQRRSFGTLARSPMLHPDQDRSACNWLEKKCIASPRESWSWSARSAIDRRCTLRIVRTISRLPSAVENYSNLRMEGLTRLQEHRLELQHRLDMHRTQMEMPPSPSPSSRSLAPFSSASSSLSEGSNQPSGEDSASIVTGTLFFSHSIPFNPFSASALRWWGDQNQEVCSSMIHKRTAETRTSCKKYSESHERANCQRYEEADGRFFYWIYRTNGRTIVMCIYTITTKNRRRCAKVVEWYDERIIGRPTWLWWFVHVSVFGVPEDIRDPELMAPPCQSSERVGSRSWRDTLRLFSLAAAF